jgi:hypothetical protein
MIETLANRFILEYTGLYKVIHKPRLDVYTLQLPTTLVGHPTFHVSKLKPIHDNKKRKDQKQTYHPRFYLIEHKIVRDVECTLTTRQSKQIANQYLVKWKGCHPKESHLVKFAYLDHLVKMVEKFEWELGHEMETKKCIKKIQHIKVTLMKTSTS